MPLLELTGICKSFPGVIALEDVNFDVNSGEIHALLGQNGAGKSTLLKVLTGAYTADKGTITLDGKPISPTSPFEAVRLGISCVYQEINLAPNLTVAENICLGTESRGWTGIRWKAMRERAVRALDRVGLQLDVDTPLESHSIALQQMVAIARAIDVDAQVLVLDEPTSSLDHREVTHLFEAMQRLRTQGMGIVFVTHFLEQVYEICDRMTVLRNGKVVQTAPVAEVTRHELVKTMLGREAGVLEAAAHETSPAQSPAVVEMNNISKRGAITEATLEVRQGEVLGFAGLLGSGRTETLRLMFGIDKADQGEISVDGTKQRKWTIRKAIRSGIGLCPEDRKHEAIIGEMGVAENIALVLQAKRGWARKIPRQQQAKIAQDLIAQLGIVASDIDKPVQELSGGNQQKVILARWLATQPRLVLLDEPTRGIDVGAKAEILTWIQREKKAGTSFVFVSAELPEVLAMSDRLAVFRERRLSEVLPREQVTEEHVLRAIAEGGE